VTEPRFFVLTAGDTPEAAIDLVEERGFTAKATPFLYQACSVGVYGAAEIERPSTSDEP
jgi:hypothetical protein